MCLHWEEGQKDPMTPSSLSLGFWSIVWRVGQEYRHLITLAKDFIHTSILHWPISILGFSGGTKSPSLPTKPGLLCSKHRSFMCWAGTVLPPGGSAVHRVAHLFLDNSSVHINTFGTTRCLIGAKDKTILHLH